MKKESNRLYRTMLIAAIAAIVLTPLWAFAEGSRTQRPGDAMSDPSMNQPSSYEERATDMTGGRQGVVGKYDVVPVRHGELVDEKGEHLDQTVKNKKGETLGTIEKLLKDTKTGKIEYAVIELEQTKYQLPLQWSQFKHEKGHLTLNASQKDLYPIASSVFSKDMSPDVSQYMNDVNKVREQPKGKGEGPGAPGVPFDSVGGFGSSGPPPGQAPGYEGDHPSSKR